MLSHARVMESETIALADALNRTLAQDVTAQRAQPPFNASAMDGYAVRSADTPGALRVIGEAIAGRAFVGALGAGECVRIFTGAPIPEGADAILIQEDAERDGDSVRAPRVEAGLHVRAIGRDYAPGATLLSAATLLDPAAIAVAASAGAATLSVARRPRSIVLSGGDEVVPPGATPDAAQIHDSASHGVAALAARCGADARAATPLRDDVNAIVRALDAALTEFDLTVMIGGASVGDHDLAHEAARRAGAEIAFAKVAVRPGKPTWFAKRGNALLLGLPGNPTSALVCARLFLRPLLEAMLGRDHASSLATSAARLSEALPANGPRETYLRAMTRVDDAGQKWVLAAPDQDSSLVSVLASADALILRAPHAPPAEAGDIVPTLAI